ncbi:hypothetical protein [Acinetobacter baumannii]|uniref:hypothetical protein n=1 Tax=Acinetobacter baumannii TaxID=470 RepID=UPI003B43D485
MTDLNKEREAFEEALGKHNIHNVHLCTVYDFKRNEYFPSDVCDPSEDRIVDSINLSWKMWQEKAKAQAVPEGFKIVPIELSEEIAERLALERVQKPRPENDPVWVEIAERAYKSNLLAKKWELVREYKILTEASESGAEQ